MTKELLALWSAGSDRRKQRLFFAQLEAAETLIFLVEAAGVYQKNQPIVPMDKPGDETLKKGFKAFTRYALKMATDTGKTTVMGMLAAWSILNRVAAPNDERFADTILIVCPNVTIYHAGSRLASTFSTMAARQSGRAASGAAGIYRGLPGYQSGRRSF